MFFLLFNKMMNENIRSEIRKPILSELKIHKKSGKYAEVKQNSPASCPQKVVTNPHIIFSPRSQK